MLAGCAQPPPGRYPVDRVTFEGTNAVAADELETKIATAASPKSFLFFRGVRDYELFDRYVLERDLARVERTYRAKGYYEAHARAGRVEKLSNGHVSVTIVVDEGPVVSVADVKLEGLTWLPIDDSAAVLAAVRRLLRAKAPFDEDAYEEAQASVVRVLADRGYAFAVVKASADVDLQRHVAHVIFQLTPGQTAQIGAVTIDGLGPIPEKPVRRALDLSEGSLYSAAKLDAARRAILELGVFADAEVAPDLTHPESRKVAVTVRVVPSDLRVIKVGGGIELDTLRTDWHLLTGWEDRNFLGGLRRLTIDLRPGLVLYPTAINNLQMPTKILPEARARAELRQPGFLEARTGGTIRGGADLYPVIYPRGKDDPVPDSVPGYRDLSSGVGLDRSFGPLYASLFYNFQTSFPFVYGSSTPSGFDKVVLSYVDLVTSLDFRDDPIKPHKGVFFGNSVQIAGLPVLPNFRDENDLFARDLRILPDVRAYVPVAPKWTLAVRASTGFLFPSNYGKSFQPGAAPTPGDVQLGFFRGFFSGGPTSNRGYS
ncbi:MAG TPA: POTRA domain-containing protein, partial [Polyangiaceae bacterium]|nr:POTRA domain-containing protein [Polyangiaceae bacterium]